MDAVDYDPQSLEIILGFALTVTMSALGAFFGSYLRRRGDQIATRDEFRHTLGQIKETTKALEAIKSDFAAGTWVSQSEINYRKQQLAEFYGPIYSHLKVSNGIYELWKAGKLTIIDSAVIDMFRKQNVFISDLIVNKAHLIEGCSIPICFQKFMTSAYLFNFSTLDGGTRKVPHEIAVLEDSKWPDDFENYIYSTTERLKINLDKIYDENALRYGNEGTS